MREVLYIPLGSDLITALYQLITKDGDPSDVAVVFAGKRPSLYLKRMLGEGAGKPGYPPRFFSIEEFIDYIARHQFPDFTDVEPADAVFLLYQSIQSLSDFVDHPLRTKGFGDFFRWGRYLLDFIDMLDLENVDNVRLNSLEHNAELGYDVPESTNDLLTHVVALRDEFHRLLHERHLFTRGYKHLYALISLHNANWNTFKEIYFAGLFAITATEGAIIKSVFSAGKGQVIFEGNPREWPILNDFVTFLGASARPIPVTSPRPRTVALHAAIDTHTETLIASDILKESLPGRTAMVLPSPETLFPLLSFAMNDVDGPYNISLGYPLARTSLFDLITHVIYAQAQMRENGRYPLTEYLAVMTHPFVKNLRTEPDLRAALGRLEGILVDNTVENNLTHRPLLTLEEIEGALNAASLHPGIMEVHNHFFRSLAGAVTLSAFAERLGDLLEFVLNRTAVHSFILSGEIFKEIFTALEGVRNMHFSSLVLHSDEAENRRVICDLIFTHLSALKIPFETKPIEDTEVIGFLESRSIPFDTVIIFDVNEGILPQSKRINPLIPLGIYDVLHLPSPEHHEEIFRYHFYRLVNSARNVHLLYIDAEDRSRSRYLEQIIWDEERAAGAIGIMDIDKAGYKINVHLHKYEPAVEKSAAIVRILRTKILSPSAIDDYIACPLIFYYRHVLHFAERRRSGEDMEATDRGRLVHTVLHDTFEGFLNEELGPPDCERLLSGLHQVLKRRMSKQGMNGEYYLFKRLTAFKLESFIRKYVGGSSHPFVVKDLETKIEDAIDLKGLTVRLRGVIDRIDYVPDTGFYHLLDYKTGSLKQYPRGIIKRCSFASMAHIHQYVPSFQLPLYVYLFMRLRNVPLDCVDAKLVLLRSNDEEGLFTGLSGEDKEHLFDCYMEGLETIVGDLFDETKPLAPFDRESCPTCPFNVLCHV